MSGGASATTIAAAVGAVTAVAGTALSAVSASNQSAAASNQAKYQSQVFRNNAILAQRAADRAREQGNIDAQNKAIETRRLIARQQSVLAGNGLDISSGTPLDIVGDTAAIGNTDKQTILNNAQVTADNYLAQGGNFNAQAQLASNSANGGQLDMYGNILSGVGTVAQKWYQYSQSTSGTTTPNYSGIGTGTDYSRFKGVF